MANCNCFEDGRGATQSVLEGWIQINGAGCDNPMIYAMTGEGFPGIRVTNIVNNLRGAITRRTLRGRGNTKINCGFTEADPDDNTVTVEFTDCSCTGYTPDVFLSCGFDIYQMSVCCPEDAGDPEAGWSKITVLRNVLPTQMTEANGVSFDTADDNPLIRSYTANFDSRFDIVQMQVLDISSQFQLDPSDQILNFVYANRENCGGDDGCGNFFQGCADQYYVLAENGDLIYKPNRQDQIQTEDLGAEGWTYDGGIYQPMALLNRRLFASYAPNGIIGGGYLTTRLDDAGYPQQWNDVSFSDPEFYALGAIPYRNREILFYGYTDDTQEFGKIIAVDLNGRERIIYEGIIGDTAIRDMAVCDKRMVAVGDNGLVLVSDASGVNIGAAAVDTTDNVTSVDIRKTGEIWIGTETPMSVWVSSNNGLTWNEKNFFFSGQDGKVKDILWVNENVGHILVFDDNTSTNIIYSTYNGGATWSEGGYHLAGNRSTASTNGIYNFLAAPCCSNDSDQANALAIFGSSAWLAGPQQG